MSDRIKKCFAHLEATGQTALIPYITLGDPDLETSFQTIRTLTMAGADMVELGIPFTDPVSDGPVIQKACDRALLNPFCMEDIFALARRVRESGIETPLILMSYANPVFSSGFDHFCKSTVDSGIDAALLTDIPPEEAGPYRHAATTHGLETIFLCSPTTTPERLRLIDECSTAYVYYVAHAGVTGARDTLPEEITARLHALKSSLTHPLCVGFGISTPTQATVLAPHADGLIVGSALVGLFEQYNGEELQKRIFSFIQSMKDATRHAPAAA